VNLTRRGALGLSIGAVAALTGQGALARPEPVGPGPVSLDIAARPIPALLARAPLRRPDGFERSGHEVA
jgi:hypothetical protein